LLIIWEVRIKETADAALLADAPTTTKDIHASWRTARSKYNLTLAMINIKISNKIHCSMFRRKKSSQNMLNI
jgi:hypothetical protein